MNDVNHVRLKFLDLIRGSERTGDGYSRALQVARVRAAYQRSYFAPALFSLVPVPSDLVASMAVDAQWRLYYNERWMATHTVEENAALIIHEVSHLLRDHERRKTAAGATDHRRWNTAGDCEINDDLHDEGLPLPNDPPLPSKFGFQSGKSAEVYYGWLKSPSQTGQDCGSGAHGERRSWELPADETCDGQIPGVDRLKAELVRREVARQIDGLSLYSTDVSHAWRRWAKATLAPKVDYMATLQSTVRRALRDATVGRFDRTYRMPHRRQACYGALIMPSFYQPKPRPGFLIDTSASMDETQLARAIAELGGLTRQLGYGADVVVACCDAAVQTVKKVFANTPVELHGGGGTDMREGLRIFTNGTTAPIDVLFIVSDCQTPWPQEAPVFPVVTIRVGDGVPPPWGHRGANKVITILEPGATPPSARRAL